MLVNPWASVSWISPASRCRSASTPAWWCAAASSARVDSSCSMSAARSRLCSITRAIQRQYTYANATAKARMPSAISAPGSPGSRHTSSAAPITLMTTTNTMARRMAVRWKHSGSSPKARNQALATWLCATANSTTSTAR